MSTAKEDKRKNPYETDWSEWAKNTAEDWDDRERAVEADWRGTQGSEPSEQPKRINAETMAFGVGETDKSNRANKANEANTGQQEAGVADAEQVDAKAEPLKGLYDALQAEGQELPRYGEFRDWMSEPTNSRALWEALRADGTSVPESYEDFMRLIGWHGASMAALQQQTARREEALRDMAELGKHKIEERAGSERIGTIGGIGAAQADGTNRTNKTTIGGMVAAGYNAEPVSGGYGVDPRDGQLKEKYLTEAGATFDAEQARRMGRADWAVDEMTAQAEREQAEINAAMAGWDKEHPKATQQERDMQMQRVVWQRQMADIDHQIASARREYDRVQSQIDEISPLDKRARQVMYAELATDPDKYHIEHLSNEPGKAAKAKRLADLQRERAMNEIRIRQLKEAKERYERGEINKTSGATSDFFSGAWHGLKDMATNPLGISSAYDAAWTQSVLNKLDRRETLSEQEEAMLESVIFSNQTDALADKQGVAYQIGTFVPMLAEIAVEFGVAPWAGATRAACVQGIKTLGIKGFKQLLRNPRFIAKVAGTATLEGASIAATTQAAKNYSEMVNRMVGSELKRDNSGRIVGTNGDDMWTAMLKTGVRAVGSNAVFLPVTGLGGQLMKAVGGSKIMGKVAEAIGKSKATDVMTKAREMVPWGNPVDGLAKMKTSELFSVALGDESWSQYTDKEANAVLLGSVLAAEAMGGKGYKAVKTAGKYMSQTYFERRMKGAYFRGRELFERRGGEKAGQAWDNLAGRMATMDGESLLNLAVAVKMMSEGKRAESAEAEALMRGTTITTDEAVAFVDFVRAMVGYQSMGGRLGNRANGTNGTDVTNVTDVTDVREMATRSFEEGLEAAPSELEATRMAAEQSRQRIVEQYGENYASLIDADPIGFMESGQAGVEEMEYINLKARQDGIEANISDAEADAVSAANAEEQRRTNRTTGMVMRARVGIDSESAREVYVVSGNVSLAEDGMPLKEGSDKMLVVMDAETGKLEYADPAHIVEVVEVRAPKMMEEADEAEVDSDGANGANWTNTEAAGPSGADGIATVADIADVAEAGGTNGADKANRADRTNSEANTFGVNDMVKVGIHGTDDLQDGMVIDINERGELTVWTPDPVDESSTPAEDRMGYMTLMTTESGEEMTDRESRQQSDVTDVSDAAAETDGMIGRSLSEEESAGLISRMESKAEVAPEVELTIENWDALFGSDGVVDTPIGTVKMGENQFTKLMRMGRSGKLGMVKPTLENPDVIIEDSSVAKPGDVAERDSSYVFVKSFKKDDGSRYYYFTSVTVSKDGKEVVISNQEKRRNAIANLLQTGKLVWKHADNVSDASDVASGLYSLQGKLSDPAAEGTDAPHTNPVGKGTENRGDMQAGALARVPLDERGKPDYEAVDSETAWDALVERAGDEDIAMEIAGEEVEAARGRLAAAEDRLKKLKEGTGKAGAGDKANKTNKANGANKADGGAGAGAKAAGGESMDIDARIAAKKAAKEAAEKAQSEAMAAVEAEKLHVAKWEEIAGIRQAREIAARAEVEKAEREAAEARAREAAERRAEEEARRQREREELEGVPDFSIDKPEDARRRGFVRVGGERIDRQQPYPADHSGYGKEVEPMFASGANPVRAKGRVLITEVDELQPSHVDGRINPAHMIPESQPKARHKDGGVSLNTADQNAKNIDPKLVTRTEDPYTGAPVVNRHREGVQGNGRLQMLRLLYEKYPEKGALYKQYLIDHAEELGVDPDYIRGLERPAMAIEIEGDDARAIELGQMTSQDNESGGIERIKPKHTARKMGDNMSKFAGLLMNDGGDGEASFSELVAQNAPATLEWMNRNGYISDTQMSSALRPDGRLTEDAVKDLKDILYQSIFEGAPTRMEEMFAALPAKAQKAILATAYRDHSSPEGERLVPEIQNAIVASHMLRSYGLFAEAKNLEACRRAIESWKAQSTIDELGNVVFPAKIFSNFALELAARFKGDTQKQIQTMLGRILDAVQGRTEDLFAEGPAKPMTVAEAIREVTGIDYKPIKTDKDGTDVDDRDALLDRGDQNGESGRRAGDGTPARREHDQAGAEPADGGRGADGVRPESGISESEGDRTDIPEPSEAQKEAGNYKKEHRRIDGYRISIENSKGSVRRGTDASGESWEVTMHNDYGYIRGTEGVDGDHIDVFLSDTPEQGDVFVVDQLKPDGSFDEHKVMYGFATEEEARQAYLSNYSPGWKGLGAITHVSKEEFKKWVESSKRKTKPFADYKNIRTEVSASSQGSVAEVALPKTLDEIPSAWKNSELQAQQADQLASPEKISDEVFLQYTKSIILPPLPKQTDDAIGAGGRSILIKRGTFAKNDISHGERFHKKGLTPNDGRKILVDALYNGNLTGRTQPATKPNYWVVIKQSDNNSVVVVEVSSTKQHLEIVGWEYRDAKGIKNLYNQAARNGGEIIELTKSNGSEDDPSLIQDPQGSSAAGLSALTSVSEGKGSGLFDDLQEDGEKRPAEKIEDFGEKIAGARKDMLRDLAKSVENVTVQSLIELPLGKAFKKPNLKKMVESGVISDSDALLAEAVMQALVFGQKKPVATRRMSSKREISDWAQRTYEGIRFLGEILSGDEARREKALSDHRAMMEDRLAKANAHIDNLRQWNPGKTFEYHESLPDEVEVIRTVLERIGYRAGDAVDLPLCRISISSNGKSYEVQSAGKQGAFWFKRYHDTLDSAIKTMETAARMKRGDMDVELPARQFAVKGQGKPHTEPTGQYEVIYFTKREDIASKTFDNEADANAFAQSNGGKVREVQRYTSEYDSYQVAVVNPLTGNSHLIGEAMPTRAEASAWLDANHEEANRQGLEAAYAEMGTKRSSREHFYIGTSYDRKAGKPVYSVIEDDKSNPWPIKKEFGSRKEAESWLKENMARLEEERKARKEKKRQMVYFNPSRDRRGPDHRQGQAATPEMFTDAFGFRGVQFGNWTSGADRQAALDQAYDALMDMAGALGLTPRAMSLDGELGLAFGARGGGGASAHYEPAEVVINLTKTNGAGALAHEWWHAVDNYLARHGGVPLGHVTHGNGLDQLRPEVRDAIDAYMRTVDNSEYARRSRDEGDYWGRGTEVAARLFESWIDYRLNGEDQHSPFLASGLNSGTESVYRRMNYLAYRAQEMARAEGPGVAPQIMSEEEFNKTPKALAGYPYPTREELESFDGVMAGIFDALSARERESGSMANERRRKYQPTMTGRGLFDGLEQSGDAADVAAAEQANNAIDSYAAGYNEYLERTQELETRIRELGSEDNWEELQEQIAQEEALVIEAREHLEEELREFYLRNNTPEDAAEIARSMVARTQAEVEVRRNGRQILRDIIWGNEANKADKTNKANGTNRANSMAAKPSGERPEEESGADGAAKPSGGRPAEAIGEEVRTAGGVIGYNAIGHLPDAAKGEFGYVERRMSLTGEFGFTGNTRVKDRGDVAYIFRALEDYSIEHVFVAFQKGENLKVMHIGMGGPAQSYADLGAIRAGYDAFGADRIYLVHNHPTGQLLASMPDQRLMRVLETAFPDIETEGIIMDTTSGRYGTFHGTGSTESHERPQTGGESAVGVMRIDRADRNRERLSEMPVIRSSADVAAFVSKQRLGTGNKVSYLVVANDGRIVGNFHTGYDGLGNRALAEEMASTATKYGGTSVIVYGNVNLRDASRLKEAVAEKSLGGVKLLDAVEVTNGLHRSAMDEGMMREPAMATGAEDFEATRDRAVKQKGIVMPGLNDATVRVVEVPRHSFIGDRPIAQARAWAKEHIVGEHELTDSRGRMVEYTIVTRTIEKYLSQSAIDKSDNLGVHLSVLKQLPEVIGESIEAEVHPDYIKNNVGTRKSDNGVNEHSLIHRFYGGVTIDNTVYRVKTTIIENETEHKNKPHSFEVSSVELTEETAGLDGREGTDTHYPRYSETSSERSASGSAKTIPAAKLLNGVEKSYDKGVKLLDESRKEDERAIREYGYDENAGRGEVREPGQAYSNGDKADETNRTNAQTMRAAERAAMTGALTDPVKERVMKASLWMAGKDSENVAAREGAVKAIGTRVGNIRKAMRIQKEYDAATVDAVKSLAGAMLESGLLDDMSGGEVKRLLGAMAASVEKNRIRESIDRMMDLVIDNQVRISKDMLDKALHVKGSKTNTAGVRIAGKLDPMGQQMVKAAREGIEGLDLADIEGRIIDLTDRIAQAEANGDDARKEEYQAMLNGMEIARGYHESVKAKDRSISELNIELDNLRRTWKNLKTTEERDSYLQEKRSIEDAIRTLKGEKADGLREAAARIWGGASESAERMKAWRQAEQERIDHIHHIANADMEGTPISAHERPKLKGVERWVEKTLNSSLGKFFLGPAGTFEQMMRLIARHSINGEGYCYDHFVRGWIRCNDRQWTSQRAEEAKLNAKAKEIAGVKRWSDLYKISTKRAGSMTWRDGGEMKTFDITQGNLMYVYMVGKMEDGIMKLRHMGITEEKMEEVAAQLDPRLKALADWLQEEFLPAMREKYDDVHMRMFGAPMAEIENYFPLKVLADAREQNMEITEGADGSPALPRTMTGAIIERKKNTLPLDILHADAISVTLDHLREMEEWAAFAEYRRDLSTLFSYTRFRNQVKNTKSIYGSGDNLWKQMVNLSLIVGGAYERKRSDTDVAAVNIAKGVTGACIALRINTALKQVLSLPAFASDSAAYRLAMNTIRPIGSWRWAMKNLPSFQQRWISRQAGNELLKKCKDDWSIYDNKFIEALGRTGIAPNAFIDALTVAIGSKSVYETKYHEYVKAGWNKETAHQKAIEDAEIAFNLSQQSSLAPFMSIMQSDRTFGTTMLTIFRNSPMSYLRQEIQAIREINNYIHDKSQMEYEVKKLQREGLAEADAKAYAKKKRNRAIVKNLFKIQIFGPLLSGLWAMGGAMWYLMAGDDDEQKEEILKEAAIRGLYGTVDGVTLGGILPDMAFNYIHKDEPSKLRETSMLPFEQEVSGAVDALTGNNPWKGAHKTVNLLSQMFTGANLQLAEDWAVAGMDFFAADEKNGREWGMLGMRLLQVPQSQTDKIYLDELGLYADEARKEPPAKLARRFAHYKATRSNIPGAIAMSAEKWAEEEDKQRKRFDRMAKELLEKADKSGYREKFEAYADEFNKIDAQYKELTAQSKRGDVDYDEVLDKLLALKDSPEYQRYDRYKKVKGMYDKSVDRWLNAETPEATIEALRDHETIKRLLVEIIERKNLESVMESAAELEDMRQRWQRRDLGWE